ncbi:MAG TPA: hypothetical protein PLP05_11470 [Sedimentisphaerales bacterium]|nr:hypothetical protein [Sedimentisphaerales bacterium]
MIDFFVFGFDGGLGRNKQVPDWSRYGKGAEVLGKDCSWVCLKLLQRYGWSNEGLFWLETEV